MGQRLALACLLLGYCVSSQATPLEFDASYTASTMGLSASARRSATQSSDNTYLIQNSLQLSVFGFDVGSVREVSEFTLNENQVKSSHYSYEQTGPGSTNEKIEFDWSLMMADSRIEDEAFTIALQPQVLDKLNFSVQLGIDLAANEQTEFSYQVLDGDQVEEHLYRISAYEKVATPLGDIDTVKLIRVRASDSKRQTSIWMAINWGYLLVKLEQVSGSGNVTKVLLEAAEIDGVALP
ncbi:MAG: DUF3108 domain-containing protein [Pseudohongiellaceae bacterium]|nr:DUF3108 domain-containing protein [Pseudohongiellaceae bacterium]